MTDPSAPAFCAMKRAGACKARRTLSPPPSCSRFSGFRLASDDIDAVIVATPDHWHSRITIDAAKAGKHVYCEKGLTRTFDEAIDVYDTVKRTGITFQLGHQNRQVEANYKAKLS